MLNYLLYLDKYLAYSPRYPLQYPLFHLLQGGVPALPGTGEADSGVRLAPTPQEGKNGRSGQHAMIIAGFPIGGKLGRSKVYQF
jgi:hypothetical protein